MGSVLGLRRKTRKEMMINDDRRRATRAGTEAAHEPDRMDWHVLEDVVGPHFGNVVLSGSNKEIEDAAPPACRPHRAEAEL